MSLLLEVSFDDISAVSGVSIEKKINSSMAMDGFGFGHVWFCLLTVAGCKCKGSGLRSVRQGSPSFTEGHLNLDSEREDIDYQLSAYE